MSPQRSEPAADLTSAASEASHSSASERSSRGTTNESPRRSEPAAETINADLVGKIDPQDPSTLVFDPADYQVYSADSAVVSFAWIAGQLGIVMWNLEPGQWNDYHMHPTTEHLHVVLRGEVEYHLADLPPIRVTAGKAVIVPATVPHGIHNIGDEPASYMAITSPGPYEKVLVDRPDGT